MEYVFTVQDLGCILDGWRGVYLGQAVQEMAVDLGWPGEPRLDPEDEQYAEASEEAFDYLQGLCAPGVYLEWNSDGVFVWPEEVYEE